MSSWRICWSHMHALLHHIIHLCMQIIDDEGESFTESNVTTAFSKVGKLGAATNEAAKEEITCTRSFQTLVGEGCINEFQVVRAYVPDWHACSGIPYPVGTP